MISLSLMEDKKKFIYLKIILKRSQIEKKDWVELSRIKFKPLIPSDPLEMADSIEYFGSQGEYDGFFE